MVFRLVFFFILLLLSSSSSHALSQFDRFRPLATGPQHYFYFSRTPFTPDTAATLEAGTIALDFNYEHSNVIGKSTNVGEDGADLNLPFRFKICGLFSEQNKGFDWNCKAKGYSIYQDGESLRRSLTAFVGLTSFLEVQYVVREISFRAGELDSDIEKFHKFMGMNDRDRQSFPKDSFGVYVWDNTQEAFIYRLESPESGYHHLSRTLTLKLELLQTESVALSLRYASNFDEGKYSSINEANVSSQSRVDFEDRHVSLDFTWLFEGWAIHLARAETSMGNPIFPQSPNLLKFWFVGLVVSLSERSQLLFQDLTYTSLFPRDGREALYQDLRERTLGFRYFLAEEVSLSFAITNNVSWQPNNIDASLTSGLSFRY